VQFESNKSLTELNTLGFSQHAEHYIEIDNDEMLSEVVEHANKREWPVFILGDIPCIMKIAVARIPGYSDS